MTGRECLSMPVVRRVAAILLPLCILPAVCISGCGYTGGKLLFLSGFGRGEKIKAEYTLTDQPVLVLVDDPTSRVNYPPMIPFLTEELGQELLRRKAAQRVIPPSTLDRLRQEEPDFEKRGAREIGRMADATEVLWLQIRDYLAEEEFSDITAAAYVSVSVKVINAKEERDRTKVRLWPESPEGRVITASLDGSTVARLKTRKAIAEELARNLAENIAKLFYDHRLGDFERPQQ
ncbi:MAG: hypothetical protein J5J06_02385 [Phycisphaerae bacterium]|nr:hypothetical protein [Phycisphaerae bacterium]